MIYEFMNPLLKDVSINELKIRLAMIVDRLNQLIKRVTEKTELGVFLIDICQVTTVATQEHDPMNMARTLSST